MFPALGTSSNSGDTSVFLRFAPVSFFLPYFATNLFTESYALLFVLVTGNHTIDRDSFAKINQKAQESPGILDSCLRKTRVGKRNDNRGQIVFEKFPKWCPSTRKRKPGIFKSFKFLWFQERFRFRD